MAETYAYWPDSLPILHCVDGREWACDRFLSHHETTVDGCRVRVWRIAGIYETRGKKCRHVGSTYGYEVALWPYPVTRHVEDVKGLVYAMRRAVESAARMAANHRHYLSINKGQVPTFAINTTGSIGSHWHG